MTEAGKDSTIFSNLLLHTPEKPTANEIEKNLLQAAGKTFLPHANLIASRLGSPVNEFEANDEILVDLFPQEFLLGRNFPTKGTLPEKEVLHLLRQRTCAFSHNARLIFLLFNQKQRHLHSSTVAGFALGNPTKMEELGQLMKDPEFLKMVEAAALNAEGDEAKAVLKQLAPLVRVMGQKVRVPFFTAFFFPFPPNPPTQPSKQNY